MSHRNTKYLDNKRIVYRRDPITDKPTQENEAYMFYENGTYECYHLFTSRAKITTYKSLKWHLLVLWYLNPQLEQEEFTNIADVISAKQHGFTTFEIHPEMVRRMVYEISMLDLDEPPKNKMRKVIFKYGNGMCKEEKLRIVGQLIGRSKTITKDNIYELMLSLNHGGWKITMQRLATRLNCSARTIHRNMGEELKREKELLNKQL
tara:strand:- start:1596 stop:2213 length:618 start_codon:yes stop_codon:yes gene_type:complete